MKSLMLIPALCVLCFGCGDMSNNSKTLAEAQADTADWQITTQVKAAIMADTTISPSARLVSVDTNDGVVTISGAVPTQAEIDRIVQIATNVSGVVSVDNQMTVSNS